MAEVWTVEELQRDYDFRAAFHEAQFGTYGVSSEGPSGTVLDNVVEVIAASSGENDERDWLALVVLDDGRFCKMFAGCDYTGWDCRAGGNIEFYSTREELLSPSTIMEPERERLGLGDGE